MPTREKMRPATTSRSVSAAPGGTLTPAPRTKRTTPDHGRPVAVAPVRKLTPESGGINSYTKALRFLASLSDFERLRIVRYTAQNFDLDRMRTLLKKLGNPQDSFRSVHIAGTKGKGSTCAMTEAMLRANGYKT